MLPRVGRVYCRKVWERRKVRAGTRPAVEGEQKVMSQTTIRALCRAFAAAALAAAGLLAVPAVGRAQEVVVMVDGEPITALDIEQRAKFVQMSTQKAPTRKEVLDGLID